MNSGHRYRDPSRTSARRCERGGDGAAGFVLQCGGCGDQSGTRSRSHLELLFRRHLRRLFRLYLERLFRCNLKPLRLFTHNFGYHLGRHLDVIRKCVFFFNAVRSAYWTLFRTPFGKRHFDCFFAIVLVC